MLPIQVKIKVAISWWSCQLCRTLDALLCSLQTEESVKTMIIWKKYHVLHVFAAISCYSNHHGSKAEYKLVRMCSQLMHFQKIFHEGSQLLNIFNGDSVVQRDPDASH